MFEQILKRLRQMVRRRHYVMTHHAWKEMNEDSLTLHDIEHGILGGEILERQRDPESHEAKYRIKGKTLEGIDFEIIGKIGPTGKLVIITVYLT